MDAYFRLGRQNYFYIRERFFNKAECINIAVAKFG